MSSYTEQDELEKLKAWWKNYGGALILGVALGLALLFGNKYWSQHQEERRQTASDIYAQMLQEARQGKTDAVRAAGAKLMEDYRRTPYAGMAALMLARISFDSGDSAAARKYLQDAIDYGRDPATEHTARLRLGRLLLDAHDYGAASALTNVQPQNGFEAEYLELRGDAFAAQGKSAQAREAYQAAIAQIAPDSPHRRTLTMKLDDVGREG